MSAAEKIDCEYTDEPVCPYCGEVQRDSWEYMDDYQSGDEFECGHCSLTFELIANVSVSWCSKPTVQKKQAPPSEAGKDGE